MSIISKNGIHILTKSMINKKIFLYCLFFKICLSANTLYAQLSQTYYNVAYSRIDSMLQSGKRVDFKKSVFLVENAYFEGAVSMDIFNKAIKFYSSISRGIAESGNIIYQEKDFSNAAIQCGVFLFMTDSIPVKTDNIRPQHLSCHILR